MEDGSARGRKERTADPNAPAGVPAHPKSVPSDSTSARRNFFTSSLASHALLLHPQSIDDGPTQPSSAVSSRKKSARKTSARANPPPSATDSDTEVKPAKRAKKASLSPRQALIQLLNLESKGGRPSREYNEKVKNLAKAAYKDAGTDDYRSRLIGLFAATFRHKVEEAEKILSSSTSEIDDEIEQDPPANITSASVDEPPVNRVGVITRAVLRRDPARVQELCIPLSAEEEKAARLELLTLFGLPTRGKPRKNEQKEILHKAREYWTKEKLQRKKKRLVHLFGIAFSLSPAEATSMMSSTTQSPLVHNIHPEIARAEVLNPAGSILGEEAVEERVDEAETRDDVETARIVQQVAVKAENEELVHDKAEKRAGDALVVKAELEDKDRADTESSGEIEEPVEAVFAAKVAVKVEGHAESGTARKAKIEVVDAASAKAPLDSQELDGTNTAQQLVKQEPVTTAAAKTALKTEVIDNRTTASVPARLTARKKNSQRRRERILKFRKFGHSLRTAKYRKRLQEEMRTSEAEDPNYKKLWIENVKRAFKMKPDEEQLILSKEYFERAYLIDRNADSDNEEWNSEEEEDPLLAIRLREIRALPEKEKKEWLDKKLTEEEKEEILEGLLESDSEDEDGQSDQSESLPRRLSEFDREPTGFMSKVKYDKLFSGIIRTVGSSVQYSCKYCKEKMQTYGEAHQHLVSHVRLVSLKCSLCGAGSFSLPEMAAHLQMRGCAELDKAPSGIVIPGTPCMTEEQVRFLTLVADTEEPGRTHLTRGKMVSWKSKTPYLPDSRIEKKILQSIGWSESESEDED